MNMKHAACLTFCLFLFSNLWAAGKSVHFDLTAVACSMMGMSDSSALNIATADQLVDDFDLTSPLPYDEKRKFFSPNFTRSALLVKKMFYNHFEYHSFDTKYFFSTLTKIPKFVKGSGTDISTDHPHISEDEVRARVNALREKTRERIKNAGGKEEREIIFGTYLHQVQDIVFHSGFGPVGGHLLVGEDIDMVVVNTDAAKLALKLTCREIAEFQSLTSKKQPLTFPDDELENLIDAAVAGFYEKRYRDRVDILAPVTKGKWSEEKRLFRNNDQFDFALKNLKAETPKGRTRALKTKNPLAKAGKFNYEKRRKKIEKKFGEAVKKNDEANRRADLKTGEIFHLPTMMSSAKSFDDLAERAAETAAYELSDEIAAIRKKDLGGIDLSNVRITHVKPGASTLLLTYELLPAGPDIPRYGITCMALAREAFFLRCRDYYRGWYVDLRPGYDNEIDPVGPAIADYTIGKVLLDSDLRLKRLFARYEDPNTKVGRNFWLRHVRHLLRIAPRTMSSDGTSRAVDIAGEPIYTRIWIESGSADASWAGGSYYLGKMELDVRLESDANAGPVSSDNWSRAARLRDIQAILVPKIKKYVNEAPEFAPLRAIYTGVVMAEAAKQYGSDFSYIYRQMPLEKISRIYISQIKGQYEREFYSKKDRHFKVDGSEWRVEVGGGIDLTRPVEIRWTNRPELAGAVPENFWGTFTDRRISKYGMLNEFFCAPKSIYNEMLYKARSYERPREEASYPRPPLVERMIEGGMELFFTHVHANLENILNRHLGGYPLPGIGSKLFRKLSYPLLAALALLTLYLALILAGRYGVLSLIPVVPIILYGMISSAHSQIVNILSVICWIVGVFTLCALPLIPLHNKKSGLAIFLTYAFFFLAMGYWFITKGTIIEWVTVFAPTVTGEIVSFFWIYLGVAAGIKKRRRKQHD
ncbi:MAG: hypothetical protein JW803_09490 [Endomicrobiales bacterium]|nr:hypothetical protein [Endomicrobiales bacterium]